MNVTLAQESEEFVKEKIRTGQFQSVDELIGRAVALLRDKQSLTKENVEELGRDHIRVGEPSGLQKRKNLSEKLYSRSSLAFCKAQ